MKIAFYAKSLIPIHAKSLEERAVGGTETGLIRMAEELQKLGHEVYIYGSHTKPPPSFPKYLPAAEIEKAPEFDIFICIRDWIPCFYKVKTKKIFFWTGDSYDQFPNYGIGDKRISDRIDALLCVSHWQATEISLRSGFPREKCYILQNGIHLEHFSGTENKNPMRLIYSSTPYRGLEFVPALFYALKTRNPELELHIFSSYEIYDQTEDPRYSKVKEELARLPDCHVHTSILQQDLARKFMKSSILFYPCHFEETSCITAMEAMAARCVPLTTRLGALPETIGDAGILIDGLPTQDSYNREFLTMAHRLLTEEDFRNNLAKKGFERAETMSWKARAKEFENFMKESL
ncbi:MAG: hypothetical protein COV44_08210 [Deltaproteobacteria bacterium CG11_big_fil_rev_8_21_14_0_20_45_16]|nr:MAG: hypothetical protein COV44_08210 [Deltaproteobacteria bacterium CG11_big_fil_rev_8_21_14_0_20_45_16]